MPRPRRTAALIGALALAAALVLPACDRTDDSSAPEDAPSSMQQPASEPPSGNDVDSDGPPSPTMPSETPPGWRSTVLGTSDLDGSGLDTGQYAGMIVPSKRTFTAKEIATGPMIGGRTITFEGIEYKGGCTRGTEVGGVPALCRLNDEHGEIAFASVIAARTPYGQTLLLARYSFDPDAVRLPQHATVMHASVLPEPDLERVDGPSLSRTLVTAVEKLSGERATRTRVRCELDRARARVMCVIAGSPAGRADGSWVGTLQSAPDESVALIIGRDDR